MRRIPEKKEMWNLLQASGSMKNASCRSFNDWKLLIQHSERSDLGGAGWWSCTIGRHGEAKLGKCQAQSRKKFGKGAWMSS